MLVGVTLAGATMLAACGSSGGSGAQSSVSSGSTAPATPATVSVRSTKLGDVLVDQQGRTLYGFASDMNGTSTCTGSCASIWPAATVTKTVTTGKGLHSSTFHTIMTNGQSQLAAATWPLYTYVGDTKPGDVNGQGIERFYVVRADGSLVKSTSGTAPSTSKPSTSPSSGSSSNSPY
jgi:predicted lipoprotein with Yx(FWY)xxD motif